MFGRMPAGVAGGLRSRVARATTSGSAIELRPHLQTLVWHAGRDSNPQRTVLETVALPTELPRSVRRPGLFIQRARPLRRFESLGCYQHRVTTTSAASHEVRCLSERMCRWLPGPLGYPETDSPLPFPTGRVDRSPPAVPHHFRNGLSSHRLHVFFREHIRELPLVASQPESRSAPNDASHGVRDPSSRQKPAVSTERAGFPLPTLRSVLGVPPALDGLLHHRPRGLVSSHSRVQGFPFRVFPSQRSRTGSLRPRALLSFLHCHPAVACAKRRCLDFKALLSAGVR